MRAIFKREMRAYFASPVGYVVVAALLALYGFFYYQVMAIGSSSYITQVFSTMFMFSMMIMPIITMRSMSDDRKNKTDQLLITSPMSITSIIVGKFLAAVSVLLITIVITFVYPVIIAAYGRLTMGTLVTNYIGFFLMGCVYISIGLLMSTLCENQVTAAVVTLVVNIMLQVLEYVPSMLSSGSYFSFIGKLFSWLSLNARNADFAAGLLSVSNILYFISFVAVVLFLAVRVVERRRWSEG